MIPSRRHGAVDVLAGVDAVAVRIRQLNIRTKSVSRPAVHFHNRKLSVIVDRVGACHRSNVEIFNDEAVEHVVDRLDLNHIRIRRRATSVRRCGIRRAERTGKVLTVRNRSGAFVTDDAVHGCGTGDFVDLNEDVGRGNVCACLADRTADGNVAALNLDVADRCAAGDRARSFTRKEADRAVVRRVDVTLRGRSSNFVCLCRDRADHCVCACGDHGHVTEIYARHTSLDVTEETDFCAVACDHKVAERVARAIEATVKHADDRTLVIDHVRAVCHAADVCGLGVNGIGNAQFVERITFVLHNSKRFFGANIEMIIIVAVGKRQFGQDTINL